MREDYVALTLNQGDQPPFVSSRRRIWRSWNQLSRLQRNLICMLSITLFLFLVYLWKLNTFSKLEIELPIHEKFESSSISHDNKASHSAAELIIGQQSTIAPKTEETIIISDVTKPRKSLDFERDEPLAKIKTEKRGLVFERGTNERQKAVLNAFKHAWGGYRQFAWGHDHLKPISGSYHDWFNLGLTIIDALDTMYIMGLKQEFNEAKDWVAHKLNLNDFNDVNLFEVTIRVLGGLLSAYHLADDEIFLERAFELGERLLPCFTKSPSAIPYSDVNLATQLAHSPRWGPDSSTSEVTTLQLEFRDLSRSTKDPRFEEAAAKVSWHVHTLPKMDGLVPVFINPKTGQFQSYADIKLGARGDSYYEYLVKQWIQTGKTQNYLKEDYLEAIAGIEKHLVRRTPKKKLLFIGELKGGTRDFVPKMDHLVCYLPGTLALGYYHGLPRSHMTLAEQLMETCYNTYVERPTHLAPEITYFNVQGEGIDDMFVKSNDAHNLLRPEFIESLWYMYEVTGNTTYQQWGWDIFQAFEKHTKVRFGYTSIGNVNNPSDTRPRDMMESFFLGETLKYFYLLFSPRHLIDIDKFIMNTEAHPLPVYSS